MSVALPEPLALVGIVVEGGFERGLLHKEGLREALGLLGIVDDLVDEATLLIETELKRVGK